MFIFEIGQMLFSGSPESGVAFWNALRLPSIRLAFQEEKGSCFRATTSTQRSVWHGWEEVDEMG